MTAQALRRSISGMTPEEITSYKSWLTSVVEDGFGPSARQNIVILVDLDQRGFGSPIIQIASGPYCQVNLQPGTVRRCATTGNATIDIASRLRSSVTPSGSITGLA